MISMSLAGTEVILQRLNALKTKIRASILRKAIMACAAPIEAAAKAFCPSDTGTLKDAIDTRFTTKGGDGPGFFVRVIIGPKRGIRVPVRTVTRGRNKGMVMIAVPTRYAHLVEFGHKIVTHAAWEIDTTVGKSKPRMKKILIGAGTVIGFVGPKPFMRPAWDTAGGERALDTFVMVLESGILAAA